MQVGDLVMMKGEPSEILGMIIATNPRTPARSVVSGLLCDPEVVYKVQWFCDLCDVTYATSDCLEVVCR